MFLNQPPSTVVAWDTFGRTDLQKISSGYPERGLEGNVRAPGRNVHLWLQVPYPSQHEEGQVGRAELGA